MNEGLLIYFKTAFISGSIFSLGIWWLLFIKNRLSARNRIFGMASLMTFIWSLGFFGLTNSNSIEAARFWRWFMESGSIFIPAIWYHFIFTHLQLRSKQWKGILLMYFISIFIWVLNLIDFFEPGIFAKEIGPKLFFPYYPTAGLGYVLFFLHFAFSSAYTVLYLHKYQKKMSGLQNEQNRFILLAAYLGFGGGGTTFLLTFGINIIPFGIFFFVFYPLTIAYAIVKYRLMNIRFIFTRSILYFLLVAVVTTVFTFTSFLLAQYVRIPSKLNETLILMMVSFIVVIGLDPLKRFLAQVTSDIFYKDKIDYQRLLRDISIIIAREIDLEILLNSLRASLIQGLKLKASDILVKKHDQYRSLASQTAAKVFPIESPVVTFLKERNDVLITDEFYRKTYDLPESDARHRNQQVLDELERNGIEFCAPVYLEGELKAIIILGQKQSGDVYGTEDVQFFTNLAPQVAVAIEKSQLYESIGEFNLKLQDKINRATRKLKETNMQLQDANAHLTQLDKAKSEFLSIASHQLRTPISALKGYLSMLLEGDFGKVADKQRQVISDLFESAARLARLINIFLNVSRIESGRFKLDKTQVDVNELVDSVIKELQVQAKGKNLELIFKPDRKIPKLYIDSDKTREVILNLIDNAIKYTPKGSISIETYQDGKEFHFKSMDTGIGIKPEDAQSLFRKFVRGTGVAQINTQGSGLGLYIAQRVISEHGGRIWVESPGLDKGSTFHFVLPITEPPAGLPAETKPAKVKQKTA